MLISQKEKNNFFSLDPKDKIRSGTLFLHVCQTGIGNVMSNFEQLCLSCEVWPAQSNLERNDSLIFNAYEFETKKQIKLCFVLHNPTDLARVINS